MRAMETMPAVSPAYLNKQEAMRANPSSAIWGQFPLESIKSGCGTLYRIRKCGSRISI